MRAHLVTLATCVAALGGVLSAVAHGFACWGIPLGAGLLPAWEPYLGLVLFGLVVLAGWGEPAGPRATADAYEYPRWSLPVVGLLMIYAVITFVMIHADSPGGSPAVSGDRYVLLHKKGQFLREIAYDEFVAERARVARLLTVGGMGFYALIAATLQARRRDDDA